MDVKKNKPFVVKPPRKSKTKPKPKTKLEAILRLSLTRLISKE